MFLSCKIFLLNFFFFFVFIFLCSFSVRVLICSLYLFHYFLSLMFTLSCCVCLLYMDYFIFFFFLCSCWNSFLLLSTSSSLFPLNIFILLFILPREMPHRQNLELFSNWLSSAKLKSEPNMMVVIVSGRYLTSFVAWYQCWEKYRGIQR